MNKRYSTSGGLVSRGLRCYFERTWFLCSIKSDFEKQKGKGTSQIVRSTQAKRA